ncbi:GntR family transcriptional regulator [Clostridium sediminicola]|uniref:GntR family transcriptional regulator n=1 Tax=Clostridium sediminicola TaxID=3114879 RepID=UPI0031F21C77
MDYKNNTPIYIQIMNLIKNEIINEKINCGEQLPSIRDISVKYMVNPNTMQKVFKELEREGIVFTKRGTGTFVTENYSIVKTLKENIANEIMDSFLESMKDLGFDHEEIIKNINNRMKKGEKDVTADQKYK